MPAYLVELPESHRFMGLVGAQDKLVVFAANVAGAREAAEGHADGDGNVLWSSLATVTEIVVGTKLSDSGDGWDVLVRLSGAAALTTDLFVQLKTSDVPSTFKFAGSVAVNDGGTATYLVGDILTAIGGTFSRAATFRVTTVSTGVITGAELADPGDYTVDPSLTANAVTGGGGTGALMDITMGTELTELPALLARFATLINNTTGFTGAKADLSANRLFTVASVADGFGDGTLVFEIRRNGSKFSPFTSTIVDGGIAAAVITVALQAAFVPPRVTGVKS